MKKFSLIILILLFVVAMTGCNENKQDNITPEVKENVDENTAVEEEGIVSEDNEKNEGDENENRGEITKVNIYLIAIEDNGTSGKKLETGDSLIPVEVELEQNDNHLEATLNKLFSIKEQNYGESGLYNALYQSNLAVESVEIKDGDAEIHLSGNFTLGGVMDNLRVKAQIEETAMQFENINSVVIYVGDKTIDEALSLKGE